MRRSYRELKQMFNTLSEDYFMTAHDGKQHTFLFLLHLKMTAFVSKKLYGDSKFSLPDIMLNSYGDLYYDGYITDDDLEYIMESKVACGGLSDYVLAFMKNSPHWEVELQGLYVEEEGRHLCTDVSGDKCVGGEYVRFYYGDFLDEEVYADEDSLDKITSYYSVGADFTDDLCVIRSSLHPYLSLFEEAAGEAYPEEIETLKQAFAIVSWWLNGCKSVITTSQYTYFLCSDDSDESYGFSYGCIRHERAMVVAAELIEEIMFSLDEIYHILPEGIKRKEEERWIRSGG